MKKYFLVWAVFLSFSFSMADAIQFEDVTEKANLKYFGDTYGSSWGDFNRDGWSDLWISHHFHYNTTHNLFINNQDGTFSDISNSLNFYSMMGNHDVHTGTWADFDNDFDQDLLIVSGARKGQGQDKNFFLINSNGTFIDNSSKFQLEQPFARSRSSVWYDFDNDGKLDVLFVNRPRDDGKSPTAIFIQQSNNFELYKEFVGLENAWMANIVDLFGNGTKYVLFFSPTADGIYNLSNDKFYELKNLHLEANHKIFDYAVSDFNNDLFPDIYLNHVGSINDQKQMDLLLLNLQNDTFQTQNSVIDFPTSCRSVASGDFDNDSDVDLYLVCSLVENPSSRTPAKNISNILLENLGNATFRVVDNAGGASGSTLGTGESVSVADYDNDGFLDLVVTNSFRGYGPVQLFRNLGNQNNWIEMDLIGTTSNSNGIGAKITIMTSNMTQFREVTNGVHYRSQDFGRIHFGLDSHEQIDKILIKWPSGINQLIENINSNRILKIIENQEILSPKTQMSYGLDPSEVICKNNLTIAYKLNGDPVCLKPLTLETLKSRNSYLLLTNN